MKPLLQVSGLSVDYVAANKEVIPALRSLDLEVFPGELLGLLGESGSGKSTLGLALMRLLPPNARSGAGQIVYKDQDLLRASSRQLREIRGAQIALIFQEPALALNPVLTAGRQIADVLRAHKKVSGAEARLQVQAILRQVGFDDPAKIARSYPHELSGGQRQRVAIAQALVCHPSLLIADEPLSSLDTVTQAEVLDLLQKLKEEMELAILLITHDAGVLSVSADRIAVMQKGEVIARGAFDDLRRDSNFCVQQLVAPASILDTAAASGIAEGSLRPIMEVRNLRKRVVQRRLFSRKAEVQALDGISLSIPREKVVALVGRSGCGKSTLARCLAGLESPDAGEILLEGVPLKELPPSIRRQVQLVFQDGTTACNPRFTAHQLIAEPLEIARWGTAAEIRARVRDLMREVELEPDSAGRLVREFSGGQRQRLALARSLALEPKLLVLDEALSGLDLPLQARMVRLLLWLQEKHCLTYLYISHDLNFVSMFADTILVMDQGKIVDTVDRHELEDSTQPETLALVHASHKLHAQGLAVAR